MMKKEEKICFDNICKKFASNILDSTNNLDEMQKDILKFLLEIYHEDRKKSIIKNENYAEIIEKIIKKD